jgi:predicted regulator of Ras-like GTPase activity (Roadblock/LC7/MglB family)
MINVLHQLNAVPGVMGSLVCDDDGKLLAHAFPPLFDSSLLEEAAAMLGSAAPGLPGFDERGGGLVELRYQDARILFKPVFSRFLLLFCQSSVNVSYLNITLKVAVKKLEKLLDQLAALPVSPPATSQGPGAATAPFLLAKTADGKGALLTVQLLAKTGGTFWDQMLENVAINRETSLQISNQFKTRQFKRLRLVNQRTGTTKVFPVQIIADDKDHRFDGKVIVSLSCMEALKVKEGDQLAADPNIGGGLFGWEGI